MADDPVLNQDNVEARLAGLVKHFKTNREELYDGAHAVCIVNGKHADGTLTSALHLHLLDYAFPETVMVLTQETLYVLASARKRRMLEPVAAHANQTGTLGVRLELIQRPDKNTNKELDKAERERDNLRREKESFSRLLGIVREIPSGEESAKLGVIAEEPGQGKVAGAWKEALDAAEGVTTVDVSWALEGHIAVLDSRAQEMMRKSGQVTTKLLRSVFVKAMENVFEEDESKPHNKLAEEVVEGLDKLDSHGLGSLDAAQADVAIEPFVQSGGSYSLDLSKPPQERDTKVERKPLSDDVVLFSWGARYSGYASFCARTYLINAPDSLNRNYNTLLEAHQMLLNELRAGVVIGNAVKLVREYLEARLPSGASIPREFGYGTGLRAREESLRLTEDNPTKVREGMCFVVQTYLAEVPIPDAGKQPKASIAKMRNCTLLLADTALVLPEAVREPNVVLTQKAKQELRHVSYDLDPEDDEGSAGASGEDDDDDEGANGDAKEKGKKPGLAAKGRSKTDEIMAGRDSRGRSARLQERKQQLQGSEEENIRRQEHQKELMRRLIEEGQRQAEKRNGRAAGETDAAEEDVKPIQAYDSGSEFPHTAQPNRITVDRARESVLLPIRGQLVPFHISTIKSVAKTEDGPDAFVRFNFHTPSQAAGKDCPPAMVKALQDLGPQMMWIKTMNFRCKDQRNMTLQVQLIKDMQKRIRAAVEQEREEADLVEQPKLVIDRTERIPRLQRLNLWPMLSGRKCVGSLEAHANGLRFRSERGEHLDIIYSNIKHAIFQPCRKEHVVLLHLHLKYPIMVGKKKRKDVQVFTEVVESSQALDGHRRSVYDPDELDEENRERQLRASLNRAFKDFVAKVEAKASRPPHPTPLEFDVPSHELGFYGVPQKEMVHLMPCTTALVALTDRPPFVVSLDDVEHVHFERVLFSGKNFDMVLILKEGRAMKGQDEFMRINAIDMKDLQPIQQWLDQVVEKTYTSGTQPMNWRSILKEYVRKPRFYFSTDEDGDEKFPGWTFLAESDDEGDDDEEDDPESNFSDELNAQEESSDDDIDEDDEDFDENVVDEDDSDEDASSDEDDEDEGDTWEDLEKQARDEDRRKFNEDGGGPAAGAGGGKKRRATSPAAGGRRSKHARHR